MGTSEGGAIEDTSLATASTEGPIDIVPGIPEPVPVLVPGILELTSTLVLYIHESATHTANEGPSAREGSPIIASPPAMVPSGEASSAMIAFDEGPSTFYDPPTVVIVGPIPESEPTSSEPEFTSRADPPIATPTSLSPLVDLTSFLEDIESD